MEDESTINRQITKDLVRKGADDIGLVVRRLRSIAPAPFMPVAVAVAGAAIVPLAVELSVSAGVPGPDPDPECMILAALLAARSGLGGPDPIGNAYADFELLKKAGRTTPDTPKKGSAG